MRRKIKWNIAFLSVLAAVVIVIAGTVIYKIYYRYPQMDTGMTKQKLQTSDSVYEIGISIQRSSILPPFDQYISAVISRPIHDPETKIIKLLDKKTIYFAKQYSTTFDDLTVDKLGKTYWEDDLRQMKTEARLIDDNTLEIEGIRLNIFRDSFDYRRDKRKRFIE